ncbi:uncharacterized protein LOC115589830 [Sparus aurata]|uniref:uncharacterized protein LOC115589830 n=1 Tax=Sparus aurata TaxID=8175 RepID=UPI0011C1351C|nr:uncharacterized protein LOC115589830 [Sparus aurata]
MRSRRSLFGILLLHMVLSVAYTDSVLPKGKNNPCPDPDKPNMVQRPITTIKGKVGDTVILPCSTENKTDISHDRVEWFKDSTTENEPIHKYVWRGHAIQTQRDDFKDRTSLSEERLLSGDCSLNLTVNTSHSGSYYCCVPGLLYCPVNLEVLPEDDTFNKHQDVTESPDKPLNGTDGPTTNYWTTDHIVAVGVGVGVGVAVVAALIALVVHFCRKRCKQRCSQRNSNNSQKDQDILLRVRPSKDEADQNPNEEQNQMLGNEDQDHPADGK